MKLVKIKTTGTLVVSLNAGQEFECIHHDGKFYVPMSTLSIGADDDDEEKPVKKASEKEEKPAAKSRSKKAAAAEPEEDEKPAKKAAASEDSELQKAVSDIIKKLDSGDYAEKKGVAALVKLNEDADEKKITKVIADFMKDQDSSVEDTIEEIVELLEGGEAPAEKPKSARGKKVVEDDEEKPAKKGKGKKSEDPEGEEISFEDAADELEKGDEVAIWWDNDKVWYNGEVKSIKKGVVLIAYEDETEEVLNEDVTTRIIKK